MRIGIDIDGVLTNIEQWQLDYGSKYYYEKYKKSIVNPKGYETDEIFDVNKQIDDKFWKECFEDYCINTESRQFASEVIKKLKEEGNEIFIITARGGFLSHSIEIMSLEKNKKVVMDWLKKNDIYYDKIIFSPEDKLEICKENNIDIMIEDKVKNINNISKQIPVICYNSGYNEECTGNNIYRAHSWYNVYTIINNLDKE